ncbi:MAG TPA: IS110 family transposase [Terriglobales bacterium]
MMIIGCDFHASFQQIAFLNTETGEQGGARLVHGTGEAEQFYRGLSSRARIGLEATGRAVWFERLLFRLGHELWVGDAARIRAAEVRKQKTDRRDAELLLRLLIEDRFPRIWVPSEAERDRRQLVLHRHRLVQLRTKVKNQLQAVALNEGIQRGRRLWSEAGREQLRSLDLLPWTGLRRDDLLEVLAEFDARIAPLDHAVRQQAEQDPVMRQLMTHPGVGPVAASAFVLTLGDPLRFSVSKQVVSYLGLAPSEHSSGEHRRLGRISKQGNSFLRSLLVEAAHIAVRYDPAWKRQYLRLAMKKNRQVAVVAIARKLAIRLWWMWKMGLDYAAMAESGSHAE